ncbi:MAG: ABC transporter permease [Chitinispirillales bacterium]|nr:ABC transporter permease [Chitinispirillales bacterium]
MKNDENKLNTEEFLSMRNNDIVQVMLIEKESFFNTLAVSVGKFIMEGISEFGQMMKFLAQGLLAKPKISSVSQQLMLVGVRSIPIVLLASVFTGFIATWQVHYLAKDMIGLQYLGMMVLKVVLSELGPTLIGLVLAGRIGAKVAAEIGTMKVTEQLDALTCLSLNPIKYIISPRIISAFLMTPAMFVYGSIAAIVASQILATVAFGLNVGTFYNSMRLMFNINDVYIGLVKSFVFGGITGLTGCYYGYTTTGGAVGVGASTRNAVVSASVMILAANLMISQVMM